MPSHFPQKQVASRFVLSKIIFYVLEIIYAQLFSIGMKLQGEDVISKIEAETGIQLAYRSLAVRLVAQFKVMSFFAAIWKPKAAFFVAPYNFMGHVKALRQRDITVIEMQHGTISKNHYAYYIPKKIDEEYYPEHLLTLGENEKEVFDESNFYVNQENVIAVGSFYLDYLAGEFSGDESFQKLTAGFNKVIAVTAQDALEELWTPFLKIVAERDNQNLYVVAPRHKTPTYYEKFGFPGNVVFAPWLNTYEVIALCDYHSTINSTTALEAPSLGTPNLLFNVENRAKAYYQSTLDDERVTVFANTADEYLNLLNEFEILPKEQIRNANRKVVVPDYRSNLIRATKTIFRLNNSSKHKITSSNF